MPTHPRTTSVEVLESRIAPALFFVGTSADPSSPDHLAIHKGNAPAGTDGYEAFISEAYGADVAVLLKKGDFLILDADNSHTLTAGDSVLMRVTSGQSLVFMTDGRGEGAGAFDKNDITGIVFG